MDDECTLEGATDNRIILFEVTSRFRVESWMSHACGYIIKNGSQQAPDPRDLARSELRRRL